MERLMDSNIIFLALVMISMLVVFGLDASRKRTEYLSEQGSQ
jgi:hypothetical protein